MGHSTFPPHEPITIPVPYAVGVAAAHEGRRKRKAQRDRGECCRGLDLCEACESEAEALKAARDE